ncbi:hypothetical protein L2E82_34652 [Cichorium intybus]|uniref:Uncharacterized protein n=1 Tax=Cichorium intybus TaxID=13427 RepID=A0ACB9BMG0_CICIN|nr:hypothetical protein L2E82_34652 [Cichorium intybus]
MGGWSGSPTSCRSAEVVYEGDGGGFRWRQYWFPAEQKKREAGRGDQVIPSGLKKLIKATAKCVKVQ